MNLEPHKYFKTLHLHSKSDLGKTSKQILKNYFESTLEPNLDKTKRIVNYSHHSKKSLSKFIPFLEERDSIGNILTKRKNLKILSPSTNLAKLKVTKDTFTPSPNKVLVMKNQFLFFDKGKKAQSKKTNSLLSELLNEKSENCDSNELCSSILKKNSVCDDLCHQILNKNHSLFSMGESKLLTEKAKYKEILKYNISPRETNFNYNKANTLLKNNLNPKEHKKLVDPLKFKKLMSAVSLLGQYDQNIDVISRKSPCWSITKTERLRNVNENPQRNLEPIKAFMTNRRMSEDFYDDRKAFAKMMKEIDKKVQNYSINTDKNLGIPEHLTWKYEKSKNFVKKFKKSMDDGFSDVKGRIAFIKTMLTSFK